jgi:hypothetical protein
LKLLSISELGGNMDDIIRSDKIVCRYKIAELFILCLIGIFMFSSACSGLSIFPNTVTPTPTITVTSSYTPTSTKTLTPSFTATHTGTFTKTITITSSLTPTTTPPSGTPMALWHRLPIIRSAVSAEEIGERGGYYYITTASQDEVKQFYINKLPAYHWMIDFISPNDYGGYIIYRQGYFDIIYIYEENGYTHVLILLAASSPSRN